MKMRQKALNFFRLCGRMVPGLIFVLPAREAAANPTGLTIVSGSATTQASGSQLNISASQNAVLEWSSFNIAAGERTVFNQPSASSFVFNHITDQNPSQIYGSLQANGIVVLLNSSGFYFGPNSFVSAAGLVVSTANCAPPQNAGGAWTFNGPPPLASIVNFGQIKIGSGGDCFFIADKIENHGDLEAPGGSIQFAAGQTVTLSERPDGRGMSMNVTLPRGSVDNYGNVIADGGTIALNAKVVNQNGFISANSVQNKNGVIELVAADELSLGANSKISAAGDNSVGGSAGGNVTLKSGNVFSDADGGQIITAGGAHGGNGGNVEISAPNVSSLNSAMDAGAQAGFTGGEFLLDPVNILLGTTGGGTVPANGTVLSTDNGNGAVSGTLNLNVNTAFANKNFSNIKLQASGDITVAANTVWNLSTSTGKNSGLLTLQAGGNINLNAGAQILDGNLWSLAMAAGYNFANNTVTPNTGSILLNGNSSIKIAAGAASLTAGKDVKVGSGSIVTTAGGGIEVHALKGSIDTGSSGQGYYFVPSASTIASAYNLSHGLGGISTMAGGSVNLTAGGNVMSVLPGNKGYYYQGNFVSSQSPDYVTAGAGAYGPQAGDVRIVAGGNVSGNYLVANGLGSIYAGVLMDAGGSAVKDGAGKYIFGATGSAGTSALSPNLALNLIKGGWNVSAAQNIFLQEVRNPNGIFNIAGSSSVKHLFDYALSDFVNLSAGNAVQLGGFVSSLPRVDSLNVPVIYPGSLTVNAGAGGIKCIGDSIYNKLILFPSPSGGLVMNTTGGGSLVSDLPTSQGAPQIFNLIVSDSGNPQYKKSTSFGINDHAATPVHLNSEHPVELNISGDMNLMLLSASEAAQVNVVGNMNNSRFLAMNLADTDVSSITVGQPAKLNLEAKGVLNPATDGGISVGGNINNRSAFTSVDLNSVSGANTPDLSLLARSQESSISVATLLNSIYYNPVTKVLTYQEIPGVSIASFVQLLQGLTVQKVDAAGNLLWLDAAHTLPATEVVSVFNSETAAALKGKYDSLGAVPGGSFGYAIGGGGKFKVTANNLDLGTTPGIQSPGIGFYQNGTAYPLANYFTRGAAITVDLAGNLNMPSTSISSFNGGDIYVNAAGYINVGSSDFAVTSIGARGIFSTGLGNVGVYAGGNVDIQGSRVAVYDTRPTISGIPTPGGSVTVVSRHGDVIVGNGGSGYVVISSYYVDPLTRAVSVQQPTIPGTGILQTSYNQTGNVLVEALAGNVVIGAGGIEQLLFKGSQTEADLNALATLFRLAIDGNEAAVEAYQKELNGIIAGAPVPFVDVYAGYGLQLLDAAHNPVFDAYGNPVVSAINLAAGTLVKTADGKNIDATGSGIVGAGTANLKASGRITGNIISLGDVNLDAQGPIIVSVFGLGTVNVVSTSGSISGTIIGVGGISASGSSVDANLESNGAISGETSGSAGFAASATSGNVAAGIGNEATTAKKSDDNSTDELNRKKKPVALAQKVSRVTVLLPKKN